MTSDQLTLFFVVLHVVSAGIWVSQFVPELALERLAQSLKGKAGQAIAVLGAARVASLMGMIGGTGILITGLLLTFEFRYGILGLFGVATPTWLVIKQVIYIIAMALVGGMVTRTAGKALPQVVAAVNASQPLPAEAEAALNRATLFSRIVNLLVLINIFIGIFAVNGGFTM